MAILVAAAPADVAAAIRQRVTIRLSPMAKTSHYDCGDCGASCTDGNSANMNANVATAISRATDG